MRASWTTKSGNRASINIFGLIAWLVVVVAVIRRDPWLVVIPAIYLMANDD